MSKYTAEQVAQTVIMVSDNGLVESDHRNVAADMLRDYATLLRERESAKAGVTDEIVETACKAAAMEADTAIFPDAYGIEEADDVRKSMRAALEAVAPMLASARVPDEWVRRLSAPVTAEELKRAWNMIGQAHAQKVWVERALIGFIELRLAAASKPETEE